MRTHPGRWIDSLCKESASVLMRGGVPILYKTKEQEGSKERRRSRTTQWLRDFLWYFFIAAVVLPFILGVCVPCHNGKPRSIDKVDRSIQIQPNRDRSIGAMFSVPTCVADVVSRRHVRRLLLVCPCPPAAGPPIHLGRAAPGPGPDAWNTCVGPGNACRSASRWLGRGP